MIRHRGISLKFVLKVVSASALRTESNHNKATLVARGQLSYSDPHRAHTLNVTRTVTFGIKAFRIAIGKMIMVIVSIPIEEHVLSRPQQSIS